MKEVAVNKMYLDMNSTDNNETDS